MKYESKELTADLPPGSGKGWAMCGRISVGIRAAQYSHFVPPGHLRRLCFRQAGSVARAVDSFCAWLAQSCAEILPKWEPLGTFILCNDCTKGA